MKRCSSILVEGTEGGEIIVGRANGSPKGGVSVPLKFVSGTKVVSGWFDAQAIITAIESQKKQEEDRLGLCEKSLTE